MIQVSQSLKERTAPAHVIVERLTNSFPSDRLSKAFTTLGIIIKAEYIIRYITDKKLRRTFRPQLNKGEYLINYQDGFSLQIRENSRLETTKKL